MKATFINSFLKTAAHEGGYVNDPSDRGGETYKGISRVMHPEWTGWDYIDVFKNKYSPDKMRMRMESHAGLQNLVEDLYKEKYWLVNKLYFFDQYIADELFDTGVNQGTKTAAKYLQRSLNKLNRNQKDYSDLRVDGNVGDRTITAYRAYMATHRFSSRNEELLIKWLLAVLNYYQLERYMRITDADLKQEKYIPGWLNRS